MPIPCAIIQVFIFENIQRVIFFNYISKPYAAFALDLLAQTKVSMPALAGVTAAIETK